MGYTTPRKDYNVLLLSMACRGSINHSTYFEINSGDFLYGGRAIVYGFLAATDPALIRGVKTLIQVGLGRGSMRFYTSTKDPTSLLSSNGKGVVVHIKLSSFQSPPSGAPPSAEHRYSKVYQTDRSNAPPKRDVEVPPLDTHDIHLNRYPEEPARLTSLLSANEERRTRRSRIQVMEEDSFEKEL
ncbi:hypothetical protein V5O48_009322 [Marasmius crinis-equi]|uniref:Uncharacterized protein n=1 Tax=Marasmius crinis-equi TaxID=585013 RepID=A0ABR3FBM4_9AGAR